MKGPQAVGHASPVSSVGEVDPHLVSLSFLLPACLFCSLSIFRWFSADIYVYIYNVTEVECLVESFNAVFHQTTLLLLLLLPQKSDLPLKKKKKAQKYEDNVDSIKTRSLLIK